MTNVAEHGQGELVVEAGSDRDGGTGVGDVVGPLFPFGKRRHPAMRCGARSDDKAERSEVVGDVEIGPARKVYSKPLTKMSLLIGEVGMERRQVGLSRLNAWPNQQLSHAVAGVERLQVRTVVEDASDIIGTGANKGTFA